jgi:predicted O-methyltransferase YrrM
MTEPRADDPFSCLEDIRIAEVLQRHYGKAKWQTFSIVRHLLPHIPSMLLRRTVPLPESDMHGFYADKYLCISAHQGAFLYLTARTLRARTVVEFGTSFGLSTMWLAAAVRANGGGRVVTAELVPEKARIARGNFEQAGLADLIEVRVGDAVESLKSDPSDIDFVLNDGLPSRTADLVRLLAPRIRPGGVVLTDDVGGFRGNYKEYLVYIRDRANGFDSTMISLRGEMEYSVRR